MIDSQPPIQTNSLTFQFLSTIHSKHLNCKSCQKLMLQPIRLHPCGHTFCIACVSDKSIKQCLICLSKIYAKQKDILASRLVGELGVRCMNSGCPWKGTFQEFRNFHQNGCRLKNGGIDAWLKQLQNTISENTMGLGNKIQEKQQHQENQKPQKTEKQQQYKKPTYASYNNSDGQEDKQKSTIPTQQQTNSNSNTKKQKQKGKKNKKQIKQVNQDQKIGDIDDILRKRMKKFKQ